MKTAKKIVALLLCIMIARAIEMQSQAPTSVKSTSATDLGTVSPNEIAQQSQKVLSLQKQLADLYNANPELAKLVKSKQQLNQEIKDLVTAGQKEIHDNQALYDQYEQAKAKKTMSVGLQKEMALLKKNAEMNQKKIANYNSQLTAIKQALKKQSSQRTTLIENLKKENVLLKKMQNAFDVQTKPEYKDR